VDRKQEDYAFVSCDPCGVASIKELLATLQQAWVPCVAGQCKWHLATWPEHIAIEKNWRASSMFTCRQFMLSKRIVSQYLENVNIACPMPTWYRFDLWLSKNQSHTKEYKNKS
jgi:hypothetical protein